MIKIAEVKTKKHLTDFIKVPWSIYGHDKNWVPPLIVERRDALKASQPIFRHLDWAGWVAYDESKPIARISAQVDRAHLEYYQNATGFFGNFESPNDSVISKELFVLAEQWLLSKEMTRVRGPFNLNINQEVGLLVEGFDTPPYFMMTHAKDYYGKLVEDSGYAKEMDLSAYLISPKFEPPKFMKAILKRLERDITICPLNKKDVMAELETVRNIFNDAWSDNWGFVPFEKDEFAAIGKEMLMVIPNDFIQIARIKNEPVAFIVLLPNINEAIQDLDGKLFPFGIFKLIKRLKLGYPKTARIPLMGVRKRLQNTRFGPGLALSVVNALRKPAIRKGIETVEMSWILENNAGMKKIIDILGGYRSKHYRVYEKPLTPISTHN